MSAANRTLTTHVGSLVRPPALRAAIIAHQNNEAWPGDFERILENSIAEVVRKQTETGIDIINDGEFGKSLTWSRYVLERLSGLEQRPIDGANTVPKGIVGKDRRDFAEFYAEYDPSQKLPRMGQWVITGPLSYRGQAAVQSDLKHFKAALRGQHPVGTFVTAVAPASVAPERIDEYYESEEKALFAIADALNAEYRAIVDAGFQLQVDDAFLATYYEVLVPPGTLADYRRWAEVRIEALNHALRGISPERVRYHVCWGSWNGPHMSDVPLKEMVDLLLKANVGAYALEMANPRHEHEWTVWKDVKLPDGKVLLPGVVSHCTNVVEHPELVAQRIVRIANLVGRDNVIASTDCGFAQSPLTQRVHPSIMWAKLRSLVEGAALASAQLWRRAA
jgi:5-methyltetrahydropteroyltriglutamate--homocysteine methyltransferase